MRYAEPTDGLQAKFSMQYILAAALVDGAVDLASFDDEAVMRPDVRSLMARVVAVEDESLRPEDPVGASSSPATGGRVEVSIRLHDGAEFTASETEPYGGPRKPLSWADIEEKFTDCARYGQFDEDEAARCLAGLRRLAEQDDVLSLLPRHARGPEDAAVSAGATH